MAQDILDCLIVGGGPAGLTAATYLARFRRSVLVVDAGDSRAAQIPESHNHPGFAGISGPALLKAMATHATRYGAQIRNATVTTIRRSGDGFLIEVDQETLAAARVLLATGLADHAPELPGLEGAVARAEVRYCPICDGYEATDAQIAVYGTPKDAANKARFLRTYSRHVTLIPTEPCSADDLDLDDSGIVVAAAPAERFARTASGIGVRLQSGESLQFDVLYPALGCSVHSHLARALGATCTDVGCLKVDDKQRTSVEGLYAAGDVVSDLHQLSVAEGHAAIAATAIHNSLPPNWR